MDNFSLIFYSPKKIFKKLSLKNLCLEHYGFQLKLKLVLLVFTLVKISLYTNYLSTSETLRFRWRLGWKLQGRMMRNFMNWSYKLTLWQREPGGGGGTEDEMAGWHHRFHGHKFEWTLGVGDGQGGLACCDSWGHKESDMTEQLNWTELMEQ